MRYTDPVTVLAKVGLQRQKQLGRLGIFTVGDLLYHFPRKYTELSQQGELLQIPVGEMATVSATVVSIGPEKRVSRSLKVAEVLAKSDDGGQLTLVFFNNMYQLRSLRLGKTYLFHGRLDAHTLEGRKMASPQVYAGGLSQDRLPVYRLTSGISETIMRTLMQEALSVAYQLPEVLPQEVRAEYDLLEIGEAMKCIHSPMDERDERIGRKRMMFEELFVLAAGLGRLRGQSAAQTGQALFGDKKMEAFYQTLPFPPTKAQCRAVAEIVGDMEQSAPANRLLQGDVGSGKTMVAAAAVYYAFTAGAQSAMMAPTELLAQQHKNTLEKLLSPLGVVVELLTGSLSKPRRRELLERVARGEVHLLVGTHALFSKDVEFGRLGLVIADEQHRFGVAQREALRRKGEMPHTLVMSATPIPRTLALMLYGELSLSVLDEHPPGRQRIRTYRADDSLRPRVYRFIKKELEAGRQAYVVCPLIEHTPESDPTLCAAVKLHEELSGRFLPSGRLGLLHGKMKAEEKDRIMASFLAGEIQLLISTTVVEVGVDVPNATVIAVENAERFGLSQLHQLRGRVGRGKAQSYCVLLSNAKEKQARERISFLCNTEDGFRLAEYDLQMRGPGNFLGQEQHGLPQMRLADLATDPTLVDDARIAARSLLLKDPELSRYPRLRQAVEKIIAVVGQRPN